MHEGFDAARRAFGDDRAIPDHGEPVAYGIGLEHVMGRQEDRLAGVRELPDDDAQLARPDWIEPDGRLVEEQDLWIVEQSSREVQALLHAAGVQLHPVLLPAREVEPFQQLGDPPPRDLRWYAVKVREVTQVVETGEPPVETPFAAEDEADPLPQRPLVLDCIQTQHQGSPRRGQQQRGEDLDHRGLACSVGTEQPEELTLGDFQIDSAKSRALDALAPKDAAGRGVGLAKLARFDRRICRHQPSRLVAHEPVLRSARTAMGRRRAEAGSQNRQARARLACRPRAAGAGPRRRAHAGAAVRAADVLPRRRRGRALARDHAARR